MGQRDLRRLVAEAVYDLGQQDIETDQIKYQPTGVPSATAEAVLGLSFDGELMLILPRGDTTLSSRRELQHLGFAERAHEFKSGKVECIEMRLVDRDLVEQFEKLAADVLERLERDPDRPDTAVQLAMARWEEFFRPKRRQGHEDEVGLMGELIVVEHLVNLDPDQRSGSWHSLGDLRDLAVVATELEVKSTTSPDSMEVHVSLLEQLADTPGTRLLLVHVRLEEHEDGRTITEVYETLTAIVSDKDHLDSVIKKSGWKADQDERRFTLRNFTLYEVDGRFPRLTPDDVQPPSGVDVKYTVDLNAASANRLNDEEAGSALQSFAEGELP